MLRRFFRGGSPSTEGVYIAAFVAACVTMVVILRFVAFPNGGGAGAASTLGTGIAADGSGGSAQGTGPYGGQIPGPQAPGGGPASPAPPLATAPPIRLEIPAIRVSSSLLRVGLNTDRTMETPTDFTRPAWYQGSAIPGNPGPTVIVGHVDSHRGPAVFFGLRTLKPGDRVTLWRADGARVNYTIQRLIEIPKNAFPTQLVYGPTPVSTLRLITCGGVFDHSTGHYLDNIIAFGTIS